jgi:hypothetical protein
LSAFVALETTTNPNFGDDNFVPLDDASVAQRLAEEYSEHGLSPHNAYGENNDPLADFGGSGVFN